MDLDLDKLTGLKNLGNTCYMNSALQILINCNVFSRFILSNSFKSTILQGYKITLLDYYYPKVTYLSPNIIKKYIASKNKLFRGYQQQDSHEFLIYILDVLEEEIKKEKKINKDVMAIHDTPIDKLIPILFDCKVVSVLTCHECGYQSKTHEPDRFLSLPIVLKAGVTLDDCYNEFLKEEILEGDEKWICDKCEHPVNASKQLVVNSTPKYLIVHLKRYTFLKRAAKINAKVDVPIEWYLRGHRYVLRGFILQSGHMNGGHYMAFIQKNGRWFCLNDARVHEITEMSAMVVSRAAYVLFYVKTKQ